MEPGLVESIARGVGASGDDLARLGAGWARVTPSLVLVPALGLRALPAAARVVLGGVLAMILIPAMPAPQGPAGAPLELLTEAARGLPVAATAAALLWAASQAGGLIDDLRRERGAAALPVVESGAPATGALFSMLASIAFLETGGPARLTRALAQAPPPTAAAAVEVAAHLVAGIELALALAAPLVVVSLVTELGGALVARAATPAWIDALLAPARSLAVLCALALVLERIAELLVVLGARA
ncbi:MAG: flagellar biosynthetic protein FliR [Polyangiaceae bacterium]|nr:flagellar biosynthetic protein FliR [Polyangiaceae bacterium]